MHIQLVLESKSREVCASICRVLTQNTFNFYHLFLTSIFKQFPSGLQNIICIYVKFRAAAANLFASSYDKCQEWSEYRITEVGCEPVTANRVGTQTSDTAPAHSFVTWGQEGSPIAGLHKAL
jgi:hypothetical protein